MKGRFSAALFPTSHYNSYLLLLNMHVFDLYNLPKQNVRVYTHSGQEAESSFSFEFQVRHALQHLSHLQLQPVVVSLSQLAVNYYLGRANSKKKAGHSFVLAITSLTTAKPLSA